MRKHCGSKEADEEIAKTVLCRLAERAERFFIYLSCGTEADTRAIVRGLSARDKLVCVPLVEDGRMRCVPITERLVLNKYGIPQPEAGEETTCDVALVPALAVDREGYRLGYGGGYYDRYFASHPHLLRIGIVYFGQLTERLPREETDVPLDGVFTERGILCFSKRGSDRFA